MRKYFILIFIILSFISCKNYNTLKWTAINVNSTGKQGDAHLITYQGYNFLIDTGQHYYTKNTLIPYLKKHNALVIDGILLSHGHFDHYGGIVDLILDKDIIVKKIYMNVPTQEQYKHEKYWGGSIRHIKQILSEAKKNNIPVIPINKGDVYKIGNNAYIKVLYVYDGIHTPVGETDINDMSVVAMLYHGKNKFLFTGDLDKKIGNYLGKNAKNLKADILKFPHHGVESFATNNFFDAVTPKVVIVPGPSNLWCSKRGKRARKLVNKNHYKAYINGFHGDIMVESNGRRYKIFTQYKPINICK